MYKVNFTGSAVTLSTGITTAKCPLQTNRTSERLKQSDEMKAKLGIYLLMFQNEAGTGRERERD